MNPKQDNIHTKEPLPLHISLSYWGGYLEWERINDKTINVVVNDGTVDVWKKDILGFWHKQ